MSEQEMDLDTAIQLFDLVQNYEEYEEGLREVLTRVHTQEELDRARVVIDVGDDAQIGTLAAQDFVELLAVGEETLT